MQTERDRDRDTERERERRRGSQLCTLFYYQIFQPNYADEKAHAHIANGREG